MYSEKTKQKQNNELLFFVCIHVILLYLYNTKFQDIIVSLGTTNNHLQVIFSCNELKVLGCENASQILPSRFLSLRIMRCTCQTRHMATLNLD